MSRRCEICGKGPLVGYNVSHARNRTKRRWLPNLQKVKVAHNGGSKRIKVCAQCIKTGHVIKPARRVLSVNPIT